MTTPNIDSETLRFFERGALIYPQPVALACGRILRSRSPESFVDSILKAAEILARYLATVSLASFAAREDSDDPLISGNGLMAMVKQTLTGLSKRNCLTDVITVTCSCHLDRLREMVEKASNPRAK